MWSRMSRPTKVILVGQGIGLVYAVHKRQGVATVITGLTIGAMLLGEYEGMKAATKLPAATDFTKLASSPNAPVTISGLGHLRLVK
jgi:hypothetical protein